MTETVLLLGTSRPYRHTTFEAVVEPARHKSYLGDCPVLAYAIYTN
jgi:hypothetical protein